MYTGAAAFATSDNLFRSQDTLYELASSTGGKALLDNNDLGQGFRNARKAFRSYYLVGYYATNTARDGKLRKVKITLNSDQTAKLDCRQTYYAEKEWGKFTAADKERQLEEALLAGDPVTELTVALEVNYFQLNQVEYCVPISVKIRGSELARAKKGGAERTIIDFINEVREGGITIRISSSPTKLPPNWRNGRSRTTAASRCSLANTALSSLRETPKPAVWERISARSWFRISTKSPRISRPVRWF